MPTEITIVLDEELTAYGRILMENLLRSYAQGVMMGRDFDLLVGQLNDVGRELAEQNEAENRDAQFEAAEISRVIAASTARKQIEMEPTDPEQFGLELPDTPCTDGE